MKTYSEKLKDPRWQRKRLEILNRDNFSCVDCETKTKQLSVHHTYYVTGRMPWMYPDWSLSTLCNQCHRDRHEEVITKVGLCDDGEVWTCDEWEAVVNFMGIEKIGDFGSWWDISVMIAMRREEFKSRGIQPIDWLTWAYETFKAVEDGQEGSL